MNAMEQYYLELTDNSRKKNYRLQRNRVLWKPVDSDELSKADFLTDDPSEIIRLLSKIEGDTRKTTTDFFVRLKIIRTGFQSFHDKRSA